MDLHNQWIDASLLPVPVKYLCGNIIKYQNNFISLQEKRENRHENLVPLSFARNGHALLWALLALHLLHRANLLHKKPPWQKNAFKQTSLSFMTTVTSIMTRTDLATHDNCHKYHGYLEISFSRYTQINIFGKFVKSDCNYTFPIGLVPTGIPFGAKSFGKE